MSKSKDRLVVARIIQATFLIGVIAFINRGIPGATTILIIAISIIVVLSSILVIDWFDQGHQDRPTKITSEGISHYPRGALTFHKWSEIKYFQLEYDKIRKYRRTIKDLYSLYIVFKDGRESVQIYETTSNKEELRSLADALVNRMRLTLLLPYDKQLLYEVNLKNGKPTVSNYLSDDSWSPKLGPY